MKLKGETTQTKALDKCLLITTVLLLLNGLFLAVKKYLLFGQETWHKKFDLCYTQASKISLLSVAHIS